MKKIKHTLFATLLLLISLSNVQAHDLRSLAFEHGISWTKSETRGASELTEPIRQKNEAIALAKRILAKTTQVPPSAAAVMPHAVVRLAKTWEPGSTLKVCFYEGGGSIRKLILSHADEWARHGNLTFDGGYPPDFRSCAPNDGAVIRISFRLPNYASFVGTDALYHAARDQPTMALRDFDFLDLSSEDARLFIQWITLHEFGHAIGFEHEHQHPASVCEEQFDKAAIMRRVGWTDAEYEENIPRLTPSSILPITDEGLRSRVIQNGDSVAITKYDPESIMHYSLYPSDFKQPPGSCYVPQVYELSDRDKLAVRYAYGTTPTIEFRTQYNSAIRFLQENTESEAERRVLERLIRSR